MLVVSTLIWDPNSHSQSFSRIYDESWVEKLHGGFRRNLNEPFRFIVFTDRLREFGDGIEQRLMTSREPTYSDCLEPYSVDAPMILVGLDTVVTGNIDHLAAYCLEDTFNRGELALPRDPYRMNQACNGVALIPRGMAKVWRERSGLDDMAEVRRWPHRFIDDLFPGQVVSFKGHAKKNGIAGVKICYFHGMEKPHELPRVQWIKEHWRA